MDTIYWEAYYSRRIAEQLPSLFARHVAGLIGGTSRKIIELGCGNGRDALPFASKGHDVLAVDQCANEIAFLQSWHMQLVNIRFPCADFSQLPDSADGRKYDVIYSRFTLHSISVEQEVLMQT
jgi:ubiquinone/menaquinone biosynthesis C-methylase UbiE